MTSRGALLAVLLTTGGMSAQNTINGVPNQSIPTVIKDLKADFGAVCDGGHAAADTTALQTALSSANSGISIHLPKGTCQINNSGSGGLSISGFSGRIYGDGSGTIISCQNISNDCLTFNSPSGLILDSFNMSFAGSTTSRSFTTGRLLTVSGGSNIALSHLALSNGNVVGLEVQQAQHINLDGISATGFLANGIFTVNNVDLKAVNIATSNNGDAGFESSFYDGETSTSCDQISLSNFTSSNDEAGVLINSCTHVTVNGFSVSSPTNIGVLVYQDATTTTTKVPDDITISNGSITNAGYGTGGNANAYGLYGNIATSALTAPSRVNVSNLIIRNTTGPGIQFGDSNTFVLQMSNIYVDTTGTGTAAPGIYLNGNEAHLSNVRVSNAGLQSLVLYQTKLFTASNFTSINPNTAHTDTKAIWDESNGTVLFDGVNLIDTYATTGRSQITNASQYGLHEYFNINPVVTGTWQGVSIAANTGNGNASYSTSLSPEIVSFSATPTFSLNTETSSMLLTGNVTSFTLPNGFNGQHKILNWCEQGSGGYTVTAPSNVRGFTPIGTTLYKCSSQEFVYYTLDAAWLSAGVGITNQ